MTEQEITDMAEHVGVTVRGHYDESGSTPQELLRFANIVAEREREACVELVRQLRDNINETSLRASAIRDSLEQVEKHIRYRGEKENNHG